jgi:hypothetical protein
VPHPHPTLLQLASKIYDNSIQKIMEAIDKKIGSSGSTDKGE